MSKKKESKYIQVRQISSPIGKHKSQKDTLVGLGLNKINRVKTLPDTDSIRGMIFKVKHLVQVEEI